jgi:predicted Rossmann fold nucleotide-binding protein DprA/Smf involved in DNA uptake
VPAQVRAVVADAPAAADELIRRTGLTAAELAAALVELELLGLVAQANGLYREVMTRPESLP